MYFRGISRATGKQLWYITCGSRCHFSLVNGSIAWEYEPEECTVCGCPLDSATDFAHIRSMRDRIYVACTLCEKLYLAHKVPIDPKFKALPDYLKER